MAIGVFVGVAHIPAGSRATLLHPSAIWGAEANVVGDATGGAVSLAMMVPTGLELASVYLIDWISFLTDTAVDPGALRVRVRGHHELANVTLDNDRFLAVPTALSVGSWVLSADANLQPFLAARPIWWRRDLGGTDAERNIISMQLTNNNLGQTYQFRAGGRVFDARILSSPMFWALFGSRAGAP